MKTAIISYSYTGNNKLLGDALAKELKADHINIKDKRNVTVKSIMTDLIFHRRARNIQKPDIQDKYDIIIYMGPFWVGKIARPLLPFLRYHRKHRKRYAFITVSGGALGKNMKYEKELFKHTKHNPEYTATFYTSDMVKKPEINMKETSTYKITTNDINNMISTITSSIPQNLIHNR